MSGLGGDTDVADALFWRLGVLGGVGRFEGDLVVLVCGVVVGWDAGERPGDGGGVETVGRGGTMADLRSADNATNSSAALSGDGDTALLRRTCSDELVAILGTVRGATSGRLWEVVMGIVSVVESQWF